MTDALTSDVDPGLARYFDQWAVISAARRSPRGAAELPAYHVTVHCHMPREDAAYGEALLARYGGGVAGTSWGHNDHIRYSLSGYSDRMLQLLNEMSRFAERLAPMYPLAIELTTLRQRWRRQRFLAGASGPQLPTMPEDVYLARCKDLHQQLQQRSRDIPKCLREQSVPDPSGHQSPTDHTYSLAWLCHEFDIGGSFSAIRRSPRPGKQSPQYTVRLRYVQGVGEGRWLVDALADALGGWVVEDVTRAGSTRYIYLCDGPGVLTALAILRPYASRLAECYEPAERLLRLRLASRNHLSQDGIYEVSSRVGEPGERQAWFPRLVSAAEYIQACEDLRNEIRAAMDRVRARDREIWDRTQ